MVLHNPSPLSQRQLINCPGRGKHKKKPKLILIEANEVGHLRNTETLTAFRGLPS